MVDLRKTRTDDSNRTARKSVDPSIVNREPQKGAEGTRENKDADLRVLGKLSDRSSLRKAVPQEQTTIINDRIVDTRDRIDDTRIHRYATVMPSRVIYQDRPHLAGHVQHYDHTYRDYNGLLCRRIIWPRYRFMLHYNRGPWFTYRYFYPYYHRKYLFVSLGGYWPTGYRYVRYYWYGCHPYQWYGYYPMAREVQGDTYNYYTYNYYTDDNVAYQPNQVANTEILEDLARQEAEPEQASLADVYFEEAVKVFETGKYDMAVEKFAKAMEFAPDDMILPFAYSQALMANEQYSQAAEILRAALARVSPEKEGVFYPRGLYANEDALLGQIDILAEKTELYSFDADLQLLLGYQLLGIGETDRAVEPLMNAGRDLENANAAAVLIKLVEKIKTSDGKTEDSGTEKIPAQSSAVIEGNSRGLKEGMFLATLCALGTGAGIGRFVRG